MRIYYSERLKCLFLKLKWNLGASWCQECVDAGLLSLLVKVNIPKLLLTSEMFILVKSIAAELKVCTVKTIKYSKTVKSGKSKI